MSSLQSRELTRTEEYLRELPHVAGGDDEQVLPQRDADLRRHKQKASSVFGRRAASTARKGGATLSPAPAGCTLPSAGTRPRAASGPPRPGCIHCHASLPQHTRAHQRDDQLCSVYLHVISLVALTASCHVSLPNTRAHPAPRLSVSGLIP